MRSELVEEAEALMRALVRLSGAHVHSRVRNRLLRALHAYQQHPAQAAEAELEHRMAEIRDLIASVDP